ncbi:MAG: hypothetical protein FJ368_06175 [Pelagibacterales bacterium]|nr:hypothetical protein [Pelagibacterales bacterium]
MVVFTNKALATIVAKNAEIKQKTIFQVEQEEVKKILDAITPRNSTNTLYASSAAAASALPEQSR